MNESCAGSDPSKNLVIFSAARSLLFFEFSSDHGITSCPAAQLQPSLLCHSLCKKIFLRHWATRLGFVVELSFESIVLLSRNGVTLTTATATAIEQHGASSDEVYINKCTLSDMEPVCELW